MHGRQPVVVLDEAHLLSGSMLQEVRFLLNFHMDSVSPLSFILVGQAELRGTLRLRTFEAIAQRICQVRYHLGGLSESDTAAYIQHHLRIAGAERPIFSEQALKAVAQQARGLPRLVNSVCTACLLDACAHEQSIVDEPTSSGSCWSSRTPTRPSQAAPGSPRQVPPAGGTPFARQRHVIPQRCVTQFPTSADLPVATGDQQPPTANGDQQPPTANGDQQSPTANGDRRSAPNSAGAYTTDS